MLANFIISSRRNCQRTRISRVVLLFCILGELCFSSTSIASCEVKFSEPRDASKTVKNVSDCLSSYTPANSNVASLLGYVHRHGYGVPRNIELAKKYYHEALSTSYCEPKAYCGLKGLAENSLHNNCAVDCSLLSEQSSGNRVADTDKNAKSRAYELLAQLLRSDEKIQRTATELQKALDDILDQEAFLRQEAYQELCVGHLKRAVVTISVAHQLNREIKRRDRLIEHHKSKIQQNGNARSQAALIQLNKTQYRSGQEKRVFFEKYAKAVFSASSCDDSVLEKSYMSFEREIAQVSVTDLEQRAFKLFKQHVYDAKENRGMNSMWFDKLDLLLASE